jgi:3-oxoacyl-[acyl-carrier protein] reductase
MAARTPEVLKRPGPGSSVTRVATADEIGGLALFLASEQAGYVVGGVLLANGGRFTA